MELWETRLSGEKTSRMCCPDKGEFTNTLLLVGGWSGTNPPPWGGGDSAHYARGILTLLCVEMLGFSLSPR